MGLFTFMPYEEELFSINHYLKAQISGSMAKKKKGFTYYLRIDIYTLQGKITGAFLSIALIATTMLVFNTLEWRKLVKLNAYLAREVGAAKFAAESIRNLSAENDALISLSDADFQNWKKAEQNQKTISTITDSLYLLDEKIAHEKSTALLKSFAQELSALRILQSQAIAAQDAQILEDEVYKKHKADLQSLAKIYIQELTLIEESTHQYISDRTRIIPYLLTTQYVFAFALAGIVASLIIVNVLKRIKSLKVYIKQLAEGQLPNAIPPSRDELNSITSALNELTQNLRTITHFADEVGTGKFDTEITVFNNENELGQSLAGMRESLKRVGEEEKTRSWINEGLAKFADLQRLHNHSLEDLTDSVISHLIKYININQGAIFVVKEEYQTHFLELAACYAYDRKKFIQKRVEIGNGLVGQAYLEKEKTYLQEIPDGYVNITSGLGEASPNVLLIVPLIYNEKVVGVIELASFRSLKEHEIGFIDKVAESLAASISSVKVAEETRKLLEESQMAAEQMRAQEEEMRQNAEELEATQEEISRQMRESEQFKEMFSSLINNVDAIIYRSDYNKNWAKIYISDGVEHLLGYRPAEFLNGKKSMMTLVHPEDVNMIDTISADAVRNKKNFKMEYRLRTSKGDYMWVEDKGRFIYDERGEIAFVDGVMTDISERKSN